MDLTKRKRSRTRSHSFYVTLGTGNTGCLVAQDLALLTKVRSLVHEERAPYRALFSVLGENSRNGILCTSSVDRPRERRMLMRPRSSRVNLKWTSQSHDGEAVSKDLNVRKFPFLEFSPHTK
jgi:hypothetical protein